MASHMGRPSLADRAAHHDPQRLHHGRLAARPPGRELPVGPAVAQELAERRDDRDLRGRRHHHRPVGLPEVPAQPDPAAAPAEHLGRLRGDPPTQGRPPDAVDPGDLPRRLGADGREGEGDRHGGGRLRLQAVRLGRAARPGQLGVADQGAARPAGAAGPPRRPDRAGQPVRAPGHAAAERWRPAARRVVRCRS